MKILVIGHSVEDHIHQGDKEIMKPGGIYYSVLGLSKIISADDEIHLVTALQKSNQHLFSDVYDQINKKDINWIDEIPKVHLIIHDSEERTECYENISDNLKVDYSILQSFDGVLINMITGFDITLEQLKEIRKYFKGPIYLDVHTLSRGITENKTRVFRQIPSFSQWASSVDLIQVNEMEARTLFNYEDESYIASEVLKFGSNVFIVTKGDAGSMAYYKEQNKVESIYVPAEKAKTDNKVGLGDIFGSVFFYNYLKTKSVKNSLVNANYAAGQAASLNNFNELRLRK
jgi:sugar/nucleoside kinase (ribokinase family)